MPPIHEGHHLECHEAISFEPSTLIDVTPISGSQKYSTSIGVSGYPKISEEALFEEKGSDRRFLFEGGNLGIFENPSQIGSYRGVLRMKDIEPMMLSCKIL